LPPFALLTVMIMLRFSNLPEVNQVAKSNATIGAIGVLTVSKNGGYALI
jgi:hypothetical protein